MNEEPLKDTVEQPPIPNEDNITEMSETEENNTDLSEEEVKKLVEEFESYKNKQRIFGVLGGICFVITIISYIADFDGDVIVNWGSIIIGAIFSFIATSCGKYADEIIQQLGIKDDSGEDNE